ncbi:probable peptidylglycine alpha-hydroxylating monooxygenase 1 [Galendromus occidentalis]|uniref:peptidylglycine monooxygenase n=1 Tax=Galendromus occidentalis TaxID=34638 RepID=A0AAJ7WH17_9ACAR|nr:probable peptidylglycine alpha-hydroxylating monooxygenase 1 [Galendromus occidentalis]
MSSLVCFATLFAMAASSAIQPLMMPGVSPTQNETYLCVGQELEEDANYIIGFLPNASAHVAHHILIYGCSVPGYHQRDTPRAVWDCGEMSTGQGSGYIRAPVCAEGSQIIYAWALDAPPLELPKGIGFKIGGDSGVNFLVLQVHYADVSSFVNGHTDRSGIRLQTVKGDSGLVKRRAGVYLLGTGGIMPRKKETHLETACKIDQDITMYPFAFRTHTHKLGQAVSGWKVARDQLTKENQWTLIGKRNPQLPQMFYPISQALKVQKGDVLAARCTMYNFRDHTTFIGSTNNDEMCNFYIMYYVDGDRILDEKYCFSAGYPTYDWVSDQRIINVPDWVDASASQL